MAKKEDLRKGLKSLLKDIEKKSSTEKKEVVEKLSNTISLIKIESIEYNPFQPRKKFNDRELQELSDSIKTLGLIQPVTVRNIGGESFQLISGERRLRASRMAGLKEIPAYVRIADDQAMIEMALVENIQRSDLNPLEIAFAYQRLIDECQLTHNQVADRVGKNRSTVTNYLRILKLTPAIQNGIKQELISMGHARALVGIEDDFLQIKLFEEVVEKNLSVRALEKRISDLSSKPKQQDKKDTPELDPKSKAVKKQLSQFFESNVDLKRNTKGEGVISIKFTSDDELNDILEKMGVI